MNIKITELPPRDLTIEQRLEKNEVTIEQLKEILQPMGTFTPIAMKCTQEQFEAIKPKLEHLKIMCIDSFITCGYLINNLSNTPFFISNVSVLDTEVHNRKVYKEWNEEIFLKACGIKVGSLEQQLQKAEAEVKRLQSLIEEENNIKVGDWVYVEIAKCFFKVKKNDITYIDHRHKKITNPELIKLLEQEIK